MHFIETQGLTAEDPAIIQRLHQWLSEAVKRGVSDLHFEPFEKYYRLRFRQDGLLHEHCHVSTHLAPQIAARLKILAKLDIAERRLPQDGRFSLNFSDKKNVDFRLSTCPTLYGEKLVVRILDASQISLEIASLGLENFQKKIFLTTLKKPQGMILVTGPTGSGKTTTLYTALQYLNTLTRNISSCEDPIEITLEGINQVNINPKAGLNFATILRAFLRQDPDVIMIGEIRDLETAEIAVKAALTGHLVLSTLHTNSATETITRLINLGVPAYPLASALKLVIAQRLVRRLCQACKIPFNFPSVILKEMGFLESEIPELKLFEALSCEKCNQGYQGRTGIYEFLPISSAILTCILDKSPNGNLYKQAHLEDFWDLKRAGLEKVKQGLTTFEELNRII